MVVEVSDREAIYRHALESIADKSSCECWEVPGMGSRHPYVWKGCNSHNSDDPGEWCLCCIAREALISGGANIEAKDKT